jgi:hypothetical protein
MMTSGLRGNRGSLKSTTGTLYIGGLRYSIRPAEKDR